MRNRGLTAICIAFIGLMILLPEARAGQVDFYIGGEADTREQSFYYLGLTASRKPVGQRALFGRVFLYDQRYSFESAEGLAKVKSPGATLSAGLRSGSGGLTLAGYAGLEMRHKETSFAGGAVEKDSATGASFGAELYAFGEEQGSLSLNASYSTIDGFVWFRARAKRSVLEFGPRASLHAGLDGVAMGNSDITAFQAGGLLEINDRQSNLSILLKAGLKDTSTIGGSLYCGLELYRPF